MFSLLSKLLSFLLKPLGLVFVCLFITLKTKNKTLRNRFLIGAMIILYCFSNRLIINELTLLWEMPPTARINLPKHEVGIVLTGGLMNEEKQPTANLYLGKHADRFAQAILLYKEHKIEKILISGGDLGYLTKPVRKEGQLVADFIVRCGVNSTDILLDTLSVNTYENAKFSAITLRKHFPNKRYLLITSATHLPRAVACFKKQKINVTPFGSDYTTHERKFLGIYLIPTEDALLESKALIHELWGYVAYKIMGYC